MADNKTIKVRVKEVTRRIVSGDKKSYTLVDKFDNKYGTLDRDTGIALKKAEGRLIELTYKQNGKYKNIVDFKLVEEEDKPQSSRGYSKEQQEGQSFGNARNVAGNIVGSLIQAGLFGDLADDKVAKKFNAQEVVDLVVEIADGLEKARTDEPVEEKEDETSIPVDDGFPEEEESSEGADVEEDELFD